MSIPSLPEKSRRNGVIINNGRKQTAFIRFKSNFILTLFLKKNLKLFTIAKGDLKSKDP